MSASTIFRKTLLTSVRTHSLHASFQPVFSSPTARAFSQTASKMGGVHNIRSKDEFEKAKSESGLIVVDFFATWCGPCKQISPVVAKWADAKENENVRFYKIDVDELSDVAAELSIRAMPTFLLFKDGEKVDEFVGAHPPSLQNLLEKHR